MIKFTDVRPTFNGSSAHTEPNECLFALRSLLDDMPPLVAKGGSIASGGEVPLTVVLPRVEHLKIVDHNYGSLWWTCNKILMIKHRTNEQIKALFENPLTTDFVKLIQDLQPENPVVEGARAMCRVAVNYWLREITPRELDIARERLDQIEVIHGDLRDLGTNLDLLYISNALEHQPFDGYGEGLVQTVKSVVNHCGRIIGAGRQPGGCYQRHSTDVTCMGTVTQHHLAWNYFCVQPKFETRHRYERIITQRVLKQRCGDRYYHPYLIIVNQQKLNQKAFQDHMQVFRECQQQRIGAIR